MHGFGYGPDPALKPISENRYEARHGGDGLQLARANAPGVVFGQIGLILVIALGFGLAVNLVLFAFNIG